MKKTAIILIASLMGQMAGANTEIAESVETNLRVEQAHLEVADALATSQNKYGACGYVEAYTQDIVSAARSARRAFDNNWEYNEDTGRKFKVSAETLKAMKTTLALKEIMNMLDHKNPQTYEHALNRVVMWGPAPGAYGNTSYIEFGADNKVKMGSLELLDDYPYTKWNVSEGIFRVQITKGDKVVSVTVNGQTQEYFLNQSYEWDQMWYLQPVDEPGLSPWMNGFVDYPSECEA